MRPSSAWPAIKATLDYLHRPIGETAALSPAADALAEPLNHVNAVATSKVLTGSTSEHAWDLRLSVINHWPAAENSTSLDSLETDLDVTQLTILSLLPGEAAESDIDTCFVIFEAHPWPSGEHGERVGGGECGLNHGTCAKDIESLALASGRCGFSLPRSCMAFSKSYGQFEIDVETGKNAHLVAVKSKPARKASEEAIIAANIALDRQFLVVNYNYKTNPSTQDQRLVQSHCLRPQPVVEVPKYLTKQESNHRRRDQEGNGKPVVVQDVKTSDDDGKAAADTAKVSMLVAAAAVITAMLLAF